MDRSIAVNVILVICVSFVFSHNFLTGSFPVAVPAADATNPTIDLATEVAELATTTTTPSSTKTAPAAVVVSRGHIIARKVQDVRRLYSSTTAHEETVTNEVSEKTYEDMEFLCHHYYKDEFVVSAHVTEGGCQLECVFLKSSGLHGDSFFDTSVKKHHNINEGQNCDTGNVSNGLSLQMSPQSLLHFAVHRFFNLTPFTALLVGYSIFQRPQDK